MTRDDAKRILLVYRPGGPEDDDPAMAEALAQVRQDQELREWFNAHLAFQKAVRESVRTLPVPPGLKEQILGQRRKIVPLWRRSEWIQVAACLALTCIIAGLSVLWFTRQPEEQTLEVFRSRMVGFALRVYRMDIETNDLAQVRQFLRSQGAPADYALTAGLQATPVKGGAKLTWQGHPVSMVCFDLSKKQTLFMFVMDTSALRAQRLPGATPTLAQVGGIMTAVWSQDGKVYLLAAPTDLDSLQRLLAGGEPIRPASPRIADGVLIASCASDRRR